SSVGCPCSFTPAPTPLQSTTIVEMDRRRWPTAWSLAALLGMQFRPLKLLHPKTFAPQLARDALVANQVAGAGADEIACWCLQTALDFCRHGRVAVVEQLGHHWLELRIVTDTAGDYPLHRGDVARSPGSRHQIVVGGRFLRVDQAAQQQAVLELL